MGLGIRRIQPVDIGKQDIQVRVSQTGHQGRQIIVVTDFEFIDGYHIVFVNDGDDTPGDHFLESVAGVGVAVLVYHIVLGQQYLCHHLAIFSEDPFIDMHQNALAHSSTGLFPRDGTGFGFQSHPSHTGRTGAGRHQEHFLALVLEISQDPGHFFNLFVIDLSVGISNGAGPYFDHNPFGFCNFFAFHTLAPLCTPGRQAPPSALTQ